MAKSELGQRVLVALVAIPLVGLIAWLGGWWMGALIGAFAAAGSWELFRMAEHAGVRPFTAAGAATAAALVATAAMAPDPFEVAPAWTLLLLALALWCASVAIWRRGVAGRPLEATSVTLFGAVLFGGCLAYAVFLRSLMVEPWDGVALVAFPMLITWASDSCAYFVGRALGRRKLIPAVSPGKTVAGAVGSLVGGAISGVILGVVVLDGWVGLPVSWFEAALVGAAIAVAAQIGDLAESLLKRQAEVKDSGAFFPGHGGVFDRLDSLLFTFPIGYWLLLWMIPTLAGR